MGSCGSSFAGKSVKYDDIKGGVEYEILIG
jgi:hypothetical protein